MMLIWFSPHAECWVKQENPKKLSYTFYRDWITQEIMTEIPEVKHGLS
jgi:hypothetical protein